MYLCVATLPSSFRNYDGSLLFLFHLFPHFKMVLTTYIQTLLLSKADRYRFDTKPSSQIVILAIWETYIFLERISKKNTRSKFRNLCGKMIS